MNHITIDKFCEATGFAKGAVDKWISRGHWVRGVHYKKLPDMERLVVDQDAYDQWCDSGYKNPRVKNRSTNKSPPPLT